MENSIENKTKFFAQYWGQEVLFNRFNENYLTTLESLMGDVIVIYEYVARLKHLSSITIEDAEGAGISKRKLKQYIQYPYILTPLMYQYLQSKGYALPYMMLSVEKQIEYGWIKLL